MSDMTRYQAQGLLKVDPQARGVNISIRLAKRADFPFIDALQKSESEGLGFLCDQAWYKRIEQGNVLVAEVGSKVWGLGSNEGKAAGQSDKADLDPRRQTLDPTPVGYCMGVDRYQKRSELGIIYQMAVTPEYRRCNVAAALLQAQFDKSAYGTRLYCCWCKQSLEANRFWESMGFVPLAFRAGRRARTKKQAEEPVVHVFWQKRIRVGDVETPYWYPYETQGGSMMEGRVVLPLPPEVGWDEAVPVVLPGAEKREAEQLLLQAKVDEIAKQEKAVRKQGRKGRQGISNAETQRRGDAEKKGKGKTSGGNSGGGGRAVMGYGFGVGSGFGNAAPGSGDKPEPVEQEAEISGIDEAELERLKGEKEAAKQALKAAQRKNDPEVVAYARELRDRWQECISPGGELAGMIEARQRGKYTVGRLLAGGSRSAGQGEGDYGCDEPMVPQSRRLDAA